MAFEMVEGTNYFMVYNQAVNKYLIYIIYIYIIYVTKLRSFSLIGILKLLKCLATPTSS